MAFPTKTRSASYSSRPSSYPYRQPSRTAPSRRMNAFGSAPLGFKIIFGVTILMFAAMIIIPLTSGGYFTVSSQTNCVVTEKSTAVSDGESQYRVHTENCGTFVIEDSLIDGRFNTADMYGAIHSGETYDFTARGKRLEYLSLFPNIIEATPSK